MPNFAALLEISKVIRQQLKNEIVSAILKELIGQKSILKPLNCAPSD